MQKPIVVTSTDHMAFNDLESKQSIKIVNLEEIKQKIHPQLFVSKPYKTCMKELLLILI